MNAKLIATLVFGLGIIAALLMYQPSRDELAFPDVASARVELGDALPPLPEGAHTIQVFGHEPPDVLHMRFESDADAIDRWLDDAPRMETADVLGNLPFVLDSITWWHPSLRRGGGGRDVAKYDRLPPTYESYGHRIAVAGSTVYLW